MLLVSPFMAFVMGYGMYVFWNYIAKYTPKKLNLFFVIFLLFSVFVMVSLIYSIGDSSILGQNAEHQYFTFDELRGFEHIFNYSPINSSIYTDYYTTRFFYLPLIPRTSAEMNFAPYKDYRIGDVNKIQQYKGYTVIRTREFQRSGLYFGSSESTRKETPNYFFKRTPKNQLELERNLATLSKVYSNPSIDIFIPHSGLNS
jgi:uncharacterized membrane protein